MFIVLSSSYAHGISSTIAVKDIAEAYVDKYITMPVFLLQEKGIR